MHEQASSPLSAHPAAPAERMVAAFVARLRAAGVSQAVIAPGSRSTPLTLAFARDPGIRGWLHLDERSAGYFALGLARELGQPVALVCTSGTAAANFLPAVAEASVSRVPLVVLTADRPPELRDIGANQVIDQTALYGAHPRWTVEMPIADGSAELDRHARAVAARAVDRARAAPAGPVHVNFPFREPLLTGQLSEAGNGPPLERQPEEPAVHEAIATPSGATVEELASAARGRRGLLLCGPEQAGLPAEAIAGLAQTLGWPVLADPLSGLRAGTHDRAHVIESYDLAIREPAFAAAATPEVAIRFGAAMTSAPLNAWLAGLTETRRYVVDAAGGWRDPDATAAVVVHADAGALAGALAATVGPSAACDPGWQWLWARANVAVRAAAREAVEALDGPFEGRIPLELAEALPAGSTLVVGNSMAVRDLDSFLPSLDRAVRIVGTRGASGIDGVVSTAAGAAAARQVRSEDAADGGAEGVGGAAGPVVLHIGDLSFFHDLNGLWPVGRYGLDLVVMLVHNDGGGIFHFLPQAEQAADQFEQWFGTPHGLDFRGAVEMHGGSFERLAGDRGCAERVRSAIAAGGLRVLELRTDRHRNVVLHREVAARVGEAVRRSVAGEASS